MYRADCSRTYCRIASASAEVPARTEPALADGVPANWPDPLRVGVEDVNDVPMTYIVQRKDRFYVIAYDGIDPLTSKERRRWHSVGHDRVPVLVVHRPLREPCHR